MKTKPLCILFDAQSMLGNKTGVGYYTKSLVSALAAADTAGVELIGYYSNFMGRQSVSDLPTAPNLTYMVSRLLPVKLLYVLRRYGLAIPFELLIRRRGDFLLFPSFLDYPSLLHTPSASVIHDLAYLEMPETVSVTNRHDLETLVPRTLARSSFTLVPSEITRQAILRQYTDYTRPIVVGHIPPVSTLAVAKDVSRKTIASMGVTKPYVLYVGTLEPRKNIVNLVKAFQMLPESLRSSHALVLMGSKGWGSHDAINTILSHAADAGLQIIATGYTNDAQKAALYSNAVLLVQPSWYEGYGMPLVEAAAYGLPIVASDLPIFREVLGEGAAIFCNPADPHAISSAVQQALSDTELRKRMISAQRMLVRNLSWEDLADSVLDQIRKSIRGLQ